MSLPPPIANRQRQENQHRVEALISIGSNVDALHHLVRHDAEHPRVAGIGDLDRGRAALSSRTFACSMSGMTGSVASEHSSPSTTWAFNCSRSRLAACAAVASLIGSFGP